MVFDRLLAKALAAFVQRGSLEVTAETGEVHRAGDGTAPRVAVRLVGEGATRALVIDPELTLGELYMDGRLVIEEGTLMEFLQLLLQDSRAERSKLPIPTIAKLRSLAWRLAGRNDARLARANVAHHYDLSGRLYDLFLDRHRQYSCAYFEHEGQALDDAQRAKQRHIAAKLAIRPGDDVLEIGSGWGGLAMYLARYAGAERVRGITLSAEQLAASRRSAAEAGLSDRVAFEMEDYRATQGRFDRIVSVGMFEHVGPKDYGAYFEAAARLLAEDGVMLLHTIGRTGEPGYTNPWIRKYIFPGGHLPTLAEVMPAIERSGLMVTDIEVLRLHYAETLKAWRERFLARRDEALALYDERFCRMWEFYLALSEAAFRWEDVVVFQIQLAKRNDVLPITRDYIARNEEMLRRAEETRLQVAAE
ncbi:SAM-dependent methyltransferase [Enterovirga aerilata]|uniref:Class I SAM-dependent methyltransferase n=1 Tax=Enterovirga aerilata TaxID=2730920 RepID=A0A849I5C9_9HYPH|nr:cyclopropane-fatty-acyl-phospholipid synthase family protein [Enterovirga sp. DB1703]NNM72588.1 class I SAM-dependent methyltransferase [Enterovirga sp. DB1703]